MQTELPVLVEIIRSPIDSNRYHCFSYYNPLPLLIFPFSFCICNLFTCFCLFISLVDDSKKKLRSVFIFFHFLLDVNNNLTQFAGGICSCLIFYVLSYMLQYTRTVSFSLSSYFVLERVLSSDLLFSQNRLV